MRWLRASSVMRLPVGCTTPRVEESHPTPLTGRLHPSGAAILRSGNVISSCWRLRRLTSRYSRQVAPAHPAERRFSSERRSRLSGMAFGDSCGTPAAASARGSSIDGRARPRLIAFTNALIDLLQFLDPDFVRFPKERRTKVPGSG